jgi:iron complex outermembrane recepter protein
MKFQSKIGWAVGLAALVAVTARAHAEDAAPAAASAEEPAAAPADESTPAAATEAPAAMADASPAPAESLSLIPVPQPEAQPDASGTRLDDVVVTAQKREQRVVDVPINVSTLGRDDIQKVRVEQVRDLMGYMPNVDIKEQVPGAIPVVTIRGVGLDDFSSTNSPAAGIYVDGVPLTSLALMSFDLYDMERLEVLKGPQGTLYGRNSNAGAINVITASPSQDREGFVRAGYGSYQAKDLEGMYNLPIGDTLAVRVAGKWIKQDEGYWQSRETADEPYDGPPSSGYTSDRPSVRDIGTRDIQLARVRLAWEPLADLSIGAKVDWLRQRSEMGQPEFFGSMCSSGAQPIDPENCTDLNQYTDTDRDPYVGDYRGEFPYHIDQLGETLHADYDLGWAVVSSVTGHIGFQRYFHIDVDGNPADEFDFFQGDEVDQLTQELRLAGDVDLGHWLVGLYYAADNAQVDTPGKHDHLLNVPLTSQILADQDTLGYAVFANMDWKLGEVLSALEKFSATTGLRWGYETRDYVGGTTWLIAGQPCQPPPAGCVPGQSPGAPPTIDDTHQDSSIEDNSVSWKAGLNYAPSSAWLVYANASQGTKSGGYFSGVTTNDRQLEPYRPEELTAFELGVKRAGVVALNASVFHYDYKDLQTFMREGSAPVQYVGNVPDAKVDGLDAETTLRVIDGLTLIGGLGLLRTELGEFTGPGGNTVPAGNTLANAPEMTWNALARYELPLFDTGLGVALQGDAHYSAEMFKEATNDRLIRSDPYTIYNARASVLDMGRVWEIALWGRNLTDELYVVQGVDVSSLFIGNRNYNAPRTYGADVLWRF